MLEVVYGDEEIQRTHTSDEGREDIMYYEKCG
jgi:hypothetical protein